jgi:RNA polymerase sigma factor (sigma-70 family)
MSQASPATLSRLLTKDRAPAEEAWGDFLAAHSKLILYVARSLGGDHDAVMDRYTCILDQLRADDFRRLRTYSADGRSEFSTWLVVVAQRICLDHRRSRYGRFRISAGEDAAAREEEAAARRRLIDLMAAEVDLSTIRDTHSDGADEMLRVNDLYAALHRVLDRLEPRDRLLIKLRFEDELSMAEVARSLEFPTRFHAYRRLTQILNTLRQALLASGVSDARA